MQLVLRLTVMLLTPASVSKLESEVGRERCF